MACGPAYTTPSRSDRTASKRETSEASVILGLFAAFGSLFLVFLVFLGVLDGIAVRLGVVGLKVVRLDVVEFHVVLFGGFRADDRLHVCGRRLGLAFFGSLRALFGVPETRL